MNLVNIFMGVPQSKYAAYAILFTVLVLGVTILFSRDSMPLTQKLTAVLLMLLFSLPGILLLLFQLTCLVTGAGIRDQRPWCSLYAYIVSGLLILYCIVLIVVAIMSMVRGENALKEVEVTQAEAFTNSMRSANKKAVEYFESGRVLKSDEGAEAPAAGAGPAPQAKKLKESHENPQEAMGFRVQGQASVPAPTAEPAHSAPEPFTQDMLEGFSACGAPL